ncbi:MAG: hypothetical protein ABIE03_01605 [Patescibacteria group bacterium]|nr:hypothetical protein [Patescibacteria group bacterium]
MENKIKPEICQNCLGKGVVPSTGAVCEECRGIGALGTDGEKQYFLGVDQNNNIQVLDQKETISNTEGSAFRNQKNLFFRVVIFFVLFLLYIIFAGVSYFSLKSWELFTVATILLVGFLVLFLVINTGLFAKLVGLLTGSFAAEPEDFLSYLKRRQKPS